MKDKFFTKANQRLALQLCAYGPKLADGGKGMVIDMKNMTLENIAEACGGKYIGSEGQKQVNIKGAVTDSRQVGEGYLFIPVKGEQVDGHVFIENIFAKGAAATLSEHPLEPSPGPYILVESSLQALKDIARFYRRQLTIPIVGITGSVGKTSTKEMIASVLSEKYRVLKTAGNFNNEIGLPLTILRIQKEHEVAVVEMGISHFGEMHRLAEIARPDLCVITNIGASHLENLKDRDGVLKAKTEVFDHLKKAAVVILNGNDDKLITVKEVGGKPPVFYGMGAGNIYADGVESLGLKGSRVNFHTLEGEVKIEIPIPGEHNIYNALAAAATGQALGLSLEEIQSGIGAAETIGGRSNLMESGGIYVIDDCYNANPMSMKASIEVLKNGLGRKIAVLGDMGELGEQERQLHYEVGVYVAGEQIDTLFCVGTLSKEIAKGAKTAGAERVFHFETKEEMMPYLLQYLKEGDTILVKASHFMDFPKIVEGIMKSQAVGNK